MLDYGETITFTGEYMQGDDGQIIATFQNEKGEKTEVIVQRSTVPADTAELLITGNDNLEEINTLNVAIDQTTATEIPANNHEDQSIVVDQHQIPIDNVQKQDDSTVVVPEVKSIVEENLASIVNEKKMDATESTLVSKVVENKVENECKEKMPVSPLKTNTKPIEHNEKDLKTIVNNNNNDKVSTHSPTIKPATILKSEPKKTNTKWSNLSNKSKKPAID
ncbi:hypothetical protein BLA29_011052, partial [Euroglyphus maynei]